MEDVLINPRREAKLIKVEFTEEQIYDKIVCEPGASQAQEKYEHTLIFACPGCGRVGSIRCTNPKEKGSWLIEAGSLQDLENLTLHPSINCIGCCQWHGYLKKGVYVPC
jgi:predicted RNA-binding Zn-ribbon protein involved in translation (DUF1610 family)